MSVRLYGYFRSSSAWRVRIALAVKGISYEYAAVNLLAGEQLTEAYARINPMRAVPTLFIDGRKLSESMAIVEYLEETRPNPSLLPADPYLRAKARQLAETLNTMTQPLQNLRVLRKLEADFGADAGQKKAWAAHFIARGFDAFEATLQETSGRYCVGDEVSVADVFLVPQVFGARRYGVDVERYPSILEIAGRLEALPSFQAAAPENQPDAV